MKVVGKMGGGYMIVASEKEVLQLITGNSSPDYSSDTKEVCQQFRKAAERGEVEIKAHEKFLRMVELSGKRLATGYSAVKSMLETMLNLIEPIDSMVEKIYEEEKKEVADE